MANIKFSQLPVANTLTSTSIVPVVEGGINYQITAENFQNYVNNTAGNMTAAYFIGNGSQLTGLPAGYTDANVFTYLGSNSNVVITTTGDVTANAFIGDGSQLTGLPAGYANSNVFSYLGSNSNVVITTTGNITSAQTVSADTFHTGNLTIQSNVITSSGDIITIDPYGNGVAGNVIIQGNLTVQGTTTTVNSNVVAIDDLVFSVANNAANSTLANGGGFEVGPMSNAFATLLYSSTTDSWNTNIPLNVNGNVSGNYFVGNGSQLTGMYGNTQVFDYLGSNSNVTLTTTGNVTAAYVAGDGSQLTNLPITITANIANGNSSVSINTVDGPISLTQNGQGIGTISDAQVSLGLLAGETGQGTLAVAIGESAGGLNQGQGAIALGYRAGENTQSPSAVAIGIDAGTTTQGDSAVAIGLNSGSTNQGDFSVAIGAFAGNTNQPNNSIIINATGTNLDATQTGFVVAPVRSDTGNTANALYYNSTTNEITYAPPAPTYGNADVFNYLGSNSNVVITTSGDITTTANISGAFLLGNGAFISGLPAGYTDANVFTYLGSNSNVVITTTGNISGGYIIGDGSQLTNLPVQYTDANVFSYLGSNSNVVIVSTGNITTTGNVFADAFSTGNITIHANTITSNGEVITIDPYGNGIAGNVVIQGNLSVLGTTTTINSNVVAINDLVFSVANNAANTTQANGGGFEVGPESNAFATLLYSSTTDTWNTNIGLNVNGNLTANLFLGDGSQLTGMYGDANVFTYLGSNSNVVVTTTGNITTTGNVQGGYVLGDGSQLTGLYANSNVFSYLGSNSNVVIVTTGNITGSNLTSTRVVTRIGTVASAATITPDSDITDQYNVTALATAATIAAPTGTPLDGQKLTIRIIDNGTSRALTWDPIYVEIGVNLPTSTIINKYVYVGCIYNTQSSKWDVVSVATQT